MKYLLTYDDWCDESLDSTDPNLQMYLQKNKKRIKRTGAGAFQKDYTKPTNRSTTKGQPDYKDPSLDKNFY